MLGDAARVVDIVNRTAAMLRGFSGLELREAALVPELHGEADDGLAALVHDCGDGGAVHSAAHGDCNGRDGAGSNRWRGNGVRGGGPFVAHCASEGVKRFELRE